MAASHRHSINRRLAWAITLTTGVSLLVACFVFLAYDARTGRAALVEKSAMLAGVIGTNSAVALTFDDAAAAHETLGALAAVDEVTAAVIYDDQGEPFASYVPGSTGSFEPPPLGPEGSRFVDAGLEVVQTIVFQGSPVGSIYLQLDTSSLAARIRTYLLIVFALIAAAGGIAALAAQRLRRQISRPLDELVRHTVAVTEGNLTQALQRSSDDEIGELVESFNAMTRGLRALVLQVRQSIGEVSDVSRVLEERGSALASQAQRQTAAIGESGESIEQVSDSIREVNSNVERLADASRETSSSIMQLDAAIAEIASHMDQLAGAIETTSSAVSQVTASISQVVGGADSLTHASDDTAVRLQELSTSVSEVKDNAAQSLSLSEESSREAGDGMAAVRETIQAMGEIQESFGTLESNVGRLAEKSLSIEEIVQVIQDVAEQTGLLSLNAAIIAAQAGEHGRAFSVVAEQVNGLADRTHRSAREIADLIHAVQQDTRAAVSAVEEGSAKVERGVQRSNVAGEILARINEKSCSSTERVRWIVDATTRQTSDLEGVHRALGEVRTIVEQINQSSHDQQTATGEIARSVENIRLLGTGVRESTDEQRRGSRLITNAASNVTEMVNHIAQATSAQTKSSETIQTALQVFTDVSEVTTRGAEAINTSVAALLERAARLETEIGRFKTE